MKDRRRRGLARWGVLEDATVYLLGVPIQAASDCAHKQKAPDSVKNQGLASVVAKGGIEPPTRGFSTASAYLPANAAARTASRARSAVFGLAQHKVPLLATH